MSKPAIDLSKESFNFSANVDLSEAINESEKTISFIALSKNNIHKRNSFFGEEYYLSVDTATAKFNATTLYLDHNPTFENAIGKITEAKFENGNFKVKVQFSGEVEKSNEAFLKYKTGLSDSVSVGVAKYDLAQKDNIDGIPHYELTNAEIYELSAVWQGADPNAKIAKFQKPTEVEEKLQNELQKEQELSQDQEPKEQLNQEVKLNDEVKNIIDLAKITGNTAEALKAIEDGVSYAEFSKTLAQKNQTKIIKEFNIMPTPKQQDRGFSLANVILKGANPSIDLGYELENNYNKNTGRFVLPSNFAVRFNDQATKTTDAAGAIYTDYREDLLISDIKKESKLLSLCSWLTNLSGRVEIPRDNSTVTADFVEEGAKRDAEKLGFDNIKLDPHTLLATVSITRTMTNMSAFNLEKFAYDAMKFAIRKKLEETILYGKGVVKGVFETSGVLTLANYLTSETTLANTLKFATLLDEAKGDVQKAVFLFKGSDEAKLRATPRTAASEKMLIENMGDLQGYKYYTTQLLKAGDCLYGDFSKLFIATFGGLELITHQERGGNITLELFLDTDAKIGREKSFVTSKTSS